MSRRLWTFLPVLVFLAAAGPAQDVIHLKNGATIEGAVLLETQTGVSVRIKSGTISLQQDLIESIERGVRHEAQDMSRALLTLSRFQDHESWHLLFRKGQRVGYRTISIKRAAQDGIPGYELEDHLVFLEDPGQGPQAELFVKEFVDAELRARSVSCRHSSPSSGWEMNAQRKGERLEIAERSAGWSRKRTAFFRRDVELPGMLLRRLSTQVPPDGGYRPLTIFDPKDVSFKKLTLQRRIDRLTFEGHMTDVLIFRRSIGGRSLETWMDMAGHVLREELGTPFLVSLRSTHAAVESYIVGKTEGLVANLGLEFFSEESGLRILRPDGAWEMDQAGPGQTRQVSFLRPGLRATVDVFRLRSLRSGVTVESLALDLLGLMQSGGKGFRVKGPSKVSLADRAGLQFTMEGRRRKEDIKTLGVVLLDQEQAFVILCSAPSSKFADAQPAFNEVLESLRIQHAPPVAPLDPFLPQEAALTSHGG